jgi:predicted RNA polymerase sigma factor
VRAKARITEARIPDQVPSRCDLPERLDGVLIDGPFAERKDLVAGHADPRQF